MSQVRGIDLGPATGFAVENSEGTWFLITNRHVVTGRHQHTGQVLSKTAATPDVLQFRLPIPEDPTHWYLNGVHLFEDDGLPCWLEHPDLGAQADVVGIELQPGPLAPGRPYSFNVSTDHLGALTVTSAVAIVGFPLGHQASDLPIWMQGHVASEPSLDYDGLPAFLIDARTRPGQSGSPVIEYFPSGFGPDPRQGGMVLSGGGPILRLHGVYSGRIDDRDLDVGLVWRTDCIREIVERGTRPTEPRDDG